MTSANGDCGGKSQHIFLTCLSIVTSFNISNENIWYICVKLLQTVRKLENFRGSSFEGKKTWISAAIVPVGFDLNANATAQGKKCSELQTI